jgi:5-methylcytosine-specific restriction endonuclease McrA
VVDEIIPVSRWREYGYSSAEAAAQDWSNLQPAHYCCNAAKSNKLNFTIQGAQINKMIALDGEW